MRALLIAILAGSALLAGCGESRQAQDRAVVRVRLAQMHSEIQSCIAERKSGIFKRRVDTVACVNTATESAYRDINYPYMDLILSLDATRLRIAEQIDNGEITKAEGQSRLADKGVEIVAEEHRRNLENRAMVAQENAAQREAYMEMIQAGTGLMQGGPSVTCTSIGNTTTCR